MSALGNVINFIKDLIVRTVGLSLGVVLSVLLFLVAPGFAIAYWPFYSFSQQSLYVGAISQAYPAQSVGANSENDTEDFYLIAGKMYCGAKLFGFGTSLLNTLKGVQSEDLKDVPTLQSDRAEYSKFLDTVAKDASTYLCPSGPSVSGLIAKT